MDSLCRVRNKIIYVLLWRTVSALTRVLFWYLLPSLLRNSGNKHQNNPLVSAATIRHTSTYIILYVSINGIMTIREWYNTWKEMIYQKRRAKDCIFLYDNCNRVMRYWKSGFYCFVMAGEMASVNTKVKCLGEEKSPHNLTIPENRKSGDITWNCHELSTYENDSVEECLSKL